MKEHVDIRKRGGLDEEVKDFVDVLLDLQENNATGVAITGVSIKALTLVRVLRVCLFTVFENWFWFRKIRKTLVLFLFV